jgi:hypothetical protein
MERMPVSIDTVNLRNLSEYLLTRNFSFYNTIMESNS